MAENVYGNVSPWEIGEFSGFNEISKDPIKLKKEEQE
jgi:hypothetical protein